eukprot:7417486-Alexandrium_andersonii.AAC.1
MGRSWSLTYRWNPAIKDPPLIPTPLAHCVKVETVLAVDQEAPVNCKGASRRITPTSQRRQDCEVSLRRRRGARTHANL